MPAARRLPALAAAALAALLAACGTHTGGSGPREAIVQRTAYGVVHVKAPDLETLAYGVAYAHAQDNVCQTAEHLVTVRGQRARWFGAGTGLFGLRALPNEQVDLFVAAHMDDATLDSAWAAASAEAHAQARGYVAGYNRFLAEQAHALPAACKAKPWLAPMTLAEYRRMQEVSMIQAGIGALADAVVAAQPPVPAPAPAAGISHDTIAVLHALRAIGLVDPPLGSNAWALGRDVTADGRGLLLGNPHFPWTGTNRFWQLHVTVPGQIDAMGASLGHYAVVQIGFNRDLAWSHTVSTGKRFTLHELTLVPGEPTSYLLDGQPQQMQRRELSIQVRAADGSLQRRTQTVWRTRWGPVVVNPHIGLSWTAARAYALQDATSGNARGIDTWLAIGRAASVTALPRALATLGTPWVNTIAADRDGRVFVADASVVPDVDAAHLERCSPQPASAATRSLRAAGLIVLDGSRSDCDWRRDRASPVPGLIPIERLPVIVRRDWVQNSNDGFAYSHPAERLAGLSPLIGDGTLRQPRTRSSLIELPELISAGPVTMNALQVRLFDNRNLLGRLVLPDLLAACPGPDDETRDGCTALRGWDRRNNPESRGAHLFREFWRVAAAIPGVYARPYDAADPVGTPQGLKMADAAVAAKVWEALGNAVRRVRAAGVALDAPLAQVQIALAGDEPIPVHGGGGSEGVLNAVEASEQGAIDRRGIRIDRGTSYLQTVGFDERGPVAQALLVYGQSSNPASPHAHDQLRLFARKTWPMLPFHPEDIARQRIGAPLVLRYR